MRQAARLYRNRYQTFYFRSVVPKSIRALVPNCPGEIRRSLDTPDPRLALKKAQAWAFLLEGVFERMKGKNNMNNSTLYLAIHQLLNVEGQIQLSA